MNIIETFDQFERIVEDFSQISKLGEKIVLQKPCQTNVLFKLSSTFVIEHFPDKIFFFKHFVQKISFVPLYKIQLIYLSSLYNSCKMNQFYHRCDLAARDRSKRYKDMMNARNVTQTISMLPFVTKNIFFIFYFT